MIEEANMLARFEHSLDKLCFTFGLHTRLAAQHSATNSDKLKLYSETDLG